MSLRFLICTDGSPTAAQAAAVGVELAKLAQAEASVLGVAAAGSDEARVRAEAARLQAHLWSPGEAKFAGGRPALEYQREVERGGYDLVIIGSRGRRGWARLALGSTAARLARFLPTPLLVIKGQPRPAFRRILACTGGEAPGERVARWAGQMARWLEAEVTVLHVMSQIAVGPQADLEQLEETAEEALTRGTREGRHLARALEMMRGPSGEAPPPAELKIRHGPVVEEATNEVRAGDYDLVVIGGHQAPEFAGRAHIQTYLIEDIADQILMAVDRPVLVVKGP